MEKEKVFDFFKRNFLVILFIIGIICFFAYTLTKDSMKKKTTYTVVEGTIEIADQTNLYLLKDEKLIDYDNTLPITAIVEQGKRASKNEAVATYQSSSYSDYLNQIEDIDKQIQTLVKDLPATYSADLTNIESKILEYAIEIQNSNSYSKMQEYKSKMDELAYRKITILSNSSPDSSAIRDLISKREELVKISKSSPNTISTPISGIVTYKIDGAEDVINYKEIENYNVSKLNEFINKYDESLNSEFGIKIINNFGAYLLVKTPVGENANYISEGRAYSIRISDLDNQTIRATLVKNTQEGNYNYSIFYLNNNIDDLIDYRKFSCEVIWRRVTGMAVPLTSIYKDETGYDYVRMVFGTEYVKVPINIVRQSDSIAIVENLTNDQLKQYNLSSDYKLELFDELIIE